MALDIKLALMGIDKGAKAVTLKDVTGVYNFVTNSGGYGGPNLYPTPSTYAYVLWRYWPETTVSSRLLQGGNLDAMLHSGLQFSPDNQGLVTVAGQSFSDGVHHVKYVPFYQSPGATATFTAGSKQVTFTGLDPQSLDPSVIKYLLGVSNGFNTGALEIDWTATISSTSLNLKVASTLSGTASYVGIGMEGDAKILVAKGADRCIASEIGTLAEASCDCSDKEDHLNKLIRWRFAADIKFDNLDYDGAHNLLAAINKQCSCTDC